ncbi:nucleotidyltransferase-like protein [Saccharibacillus sp. CPCC 101409]|uniref:nucleotidyltransferase-like protein n=1 Tax=Saccharibacillus sp. CPCC 101409 TaxID=3058041 RepID=UPI002673578A|nr:nucleotidyltransferase-like protein [Saccharibacillus sp. CPCC 101409]MDO3412812.1 nucleotidyltransferase-like protein [Saccharibacillus sp. CPCC 101409]
MLPFTFEEWIKNEPVPLGAVACYRPGGKFHGALLQDFELLVFMIFERFDEEMYTHHRVEGELHYQLLSLEAEELKRWIVTGENRALVHYFLQGEVVYDVNGQIMHLRQQVERFEQPLREQRLFFEFSRFLRSYVEAKRHMTEGHDMDAYYSTLKALHHWACIELVQQAVYPEKTIWNQVRAHSAQVYKLYEQLAFSQETLRERVELVLLACEFSVMSKMAACSGLLIRILRSRRMPWTIEELIRHPELAYVKKELPMVVRKMVYRSLIRQWPQEGKSSARGEEIRYSVD